jgi:hypothetical protein
MSSPDSVYPDETVSMDDAAEAARYEAQYGQQLSEAYGMGETLDHDDLNLLRDSGLPI